MSHGDGAQSVKECHIILMALSRLEKQGSY